MVNAGTYLNLVSLICISHSTFIPSNEYVNIVEVYVLIAVIKSSQKIKSYILSVKFYLPNCDPCVCSCGYLNISPSERRL